MSKKPGYYSRSQLEEHAAWFKRGCRGSGRIEARDLAFKGLRAHASDLSGSIFQRCDFEGSNFNLGSSSGGP